MRPAEVCGCVSSPSDSSSASSPRTVDGETPSPERSTIVFEPTGSPVAMYSSITRRRMSRLRVLSSSICRAILLGGIVAPVKPEAVARTEHVLDAAASSWSPVASRGYALGDRWLVQLDDGRTAFAKRAISEPTAAWLRHE